MIAYAQENAETLLRDGRDLFAQHDLEESSQPDIPLELNEEQYISGEKLGFFRVYTARQDGQLVGYGVFSVLHAWQRKSSKQANLEAVYMTPETRGHGVSFLRHIQRALKEEGAQLMRFHAKPGGDLDRLLPKLGYTLAHHEWELRLDQ